MGYNFNEPISISNGVKQEYVKIAKIPFSNFTTGGTSNMREILPADATITRISYWKKTAFSGGGVTAVSLNIINAATGQAYAAGVDVHTSAVGSHNTIVTSNIMQQADDNRIDIPLNFVGTATTGNPTAGELIFTIHYVR